MARPGPQGGQYRPLSEEQILRIHQASLTVLETTGIKVGNEEAKRLFQSGGARSRDDRVFLSTSMVEALAVEAIDRVGPAGHYLMDAHTVRFMRSELFHPLLARRQNRAMWEAEGKDDTRARACARVEVLLEQHQAPGLPDRVDAAIWSRFRIVAQDATGKGS